MQPLFCHNRPCCISHPPALKATILITTLVLTVLLGLTVRYQMGLPLILSCSSLLGVSLLVTIAVFIVKNGKQKMPSTTHDP